MGDEVDDLLSSFDLSEEDKQSYDLLLGKFEIQHKNAISKFNMKKQNQLTLITDLYCLATLWIHSPA